jgi:hypothetical protein
MNYSQRDQKPQNMNQRVEQRKSGVAHAACEVQVPRTYMYRLIFSEYSKMLPACIHSVPF